MWNAPITSGIALSVATGCSLFLFGLTVGLVIVGVCWAFIAAAGDRQASSSWESYPYISDDEIDILIELVRDAVAGSGWALCGDCYTRTLLMQLSFPAQESERGSSTHHSVLQADLSARPGNLREIDPGVSLGLPGAIPGATPGAKKRGNTSSVRKNSDIGYPRGVPGHPLGYPRAIETEKACI